MIATPDPAGTGGFVAIDSEGNVHGAGETPADAVRAAQRSRMADVLAHAMLGTGSYYRGPFGVPWTYTDGVRSMARICGAYWLIEAIALAWMETPAARAESFLVWRIRPDGTAVEAWTDTPERPADDDDGPASRMVARVRLPGGTDFPMLDHTPHGWILWQSDGVLYLPAEH